VNMLVISGCEHMNASIWREDMKRGYEERIWREDMKRGYEIWCFPSECVKW
jgi:hypothetical protein